MIFFKNIELQLNFSCISWRIEKRKIPSENKIKISETKSNFRGRPELISTFNI